jgi:hypothetical protein
MEPTGTMSIVRAAAALAGVKRPAEEELPGDAAPLPRSRRVYSFSECNVCGGRTPTAEQLAAHICVELPPGKRYLCTHPGCGASYKSMPMLKVHNRTHTVESLFVCEHPGCEKSFKSEMQRDSHKALHSQSRVHSCEVCSKGFHSRVRLANHLRTHTGER